MLKTATCFRISERGRGVFINDDVKAKAVGAKKKFILNRHVRKEKADVPNICV